MPLPQEPYSGRPAPSRAEIQAAVTRWIVEMQLTPGEKISDMEFARYFQVSRTPVREAFQLLEQQKLICSYPGRATFVTPIETTRIDHLYLPMQNLQCLAVRIAAETAGPEDVQALEELNQQFREAVFCGGKNTAELFDLDHAFHDKIMEIADNPYIIDFCATLWAHTQRLEYQFFKSYRNLQTSVEDHRQIIEALTSRDPFMADLAMKNNWNNTVIELQALIDRWPAPESI